jgi:hypothetical protein
MRRSFLLVAAIVVAGCAGNAPASSIALGPPTLPLASTASVLPSIPPSPSVRSNPTALLAPLAFSGATDKKTTAFTVSGTLRVSYTVSSDTNFIVDLNQTDGTSVASVANLIGSAKVTTWIYGATGPVYLDVTAGGPWTITVTEVEPSPATIPTKFSGSTDITTVPVTLVGGETVTWSYKGDGNFIVDLISTTDGSTADSLVNTIGSGSDNTVPYDTGNLALDVTAGGAWTVSITP